MPDWRADPPSAWRIDKRKWAATSFSGEGAALEGGRWNPPLIRVVYASEHLAMAAMEKLVHLPKPLSARVAYVKIPIWFDREMVESLSAETLQENWDAKPLLDFTQRLGAAWFKEKRTPVLQVPSAIIPSENNFVLNPWHPDFSKLQIGEAEPFAFDPRFVTLP